MDEQIRRAFDCVRADAQLKRAALEAVEAARRPKPGHARRRVWLAVACLAVVLFGFGFGGYLMWTPVSYIGIDINPSVELALNRFDRVLSARAYNEDGARVLDGLDLTWRYYTEAVEMILDSEQVSACLQAGDAPVISVVSGSGTMLDTLRALESVQDCGAYCQAADEAAHEAAQALDLPVGKYLMYCELVDSGVDITPEACREMSMRALRDLLAAENPDEDPGSGANGSGNGAGNGPGNGQDNGQGNGQGNGYGHRDAK